MINSKKGLSEIVTSILIILIAVAAVVVIWQILLPLIKQPGDQGAQMANCVSNPVTLSNPTCVAGGIVRVDVTKLGSVNTATTAITFTNSSGTLLSTAQNLADILGTEVATVTDATSGHGIIAISGTYTLAGSTTVCSIPEVQKVTCP